MDEPRTPNPDRRDATSAKQLQRERDSLLDTLKTLRDGSMIVDLGHELAALVQAVRDTGLKGELILKLALKPVGKGTVRSLTITDHIAVKRPLPSKGDTLVFTNDDNTLTRRDPNQPELKGLRDVLAGPGTTPATPVTERTPSDV